MLHVSRQAKYFYQKLETTNQGTKNRQQTWLICYNRTITYPLMQPPNIFCGVMQVVAAA